MSANYNHTVFAGNLTRDVDVRIVNGDRKVASGTIASNRRYRDSQDQPQEETTFLDFEAWGRTADIFAQYTQKGSPVLVDGRLRLDRWEDKDGNKRSRIKLVVSSLQLMGSRRAGADPGPGPNSNDEPIPAGDGPIPTGGADEPPF